MYAFFFFRLVHVGYFSRYPPFLFCVASLLDTLLKTSIFFFFSVAHLFISLSFFFSVFAGKTTTARRTYLRAHYSFSLSFSYTSIFASSDELVPMLSQNDVDEAELSGDEDHSATLQSVYEKLRAMPPEFDMTQTTNSAALQSIRQHLLEEDGVSAASSKKRRAASHFSAQSQPADDQSHPALQRVSSAKLSQPPVAVWNFAKRRMLTSKPAPRKNATDAWKTPTAGQRSLPQKTAELVHIQRQLRSESGPDQAHGSPAHRPDPSQSSSLLLDGLVLLNAGSTFPHSSVAVDPSCIERAAIRDAGLCGVVAEDLEYFPNLWYLDVSGNRFQDVQPFDGLASLRELHLVCNGIRELHTLRDRPAALTASSANSTLSGTELSSSFRKQSSVRSTGSPPALANVEVLNLAYNRISPTELIHLSPLPMLQRLDLSGNGLSWLPADLSFLSGVTHFALERNAFTDRYGRANDSGDPSGCVFHSLSTMPSLEEVNLAHNRITKLPVLNVMDGLGVCFPLLRCIGLADNCIEVGANIIEPLLVLTATLKTVVLSGNLIERNAVELESVFAALMDNYNVEIVVSATVSGFYYLPNEDTADTSSPTLTSSVSSLFAPSGTLKVAGLKEQPYLPPVADAFNALTSEKLPKKNWRHFYAETAPRLIVQVPGNEPTWQTRRSKRRAAGGRGQPTKRGDDELDSDDNLIGGAYDYVFSGHPPTPHADSPKEQVALLEGTGAASAVEQMVTMDADSSSRAMDDATGEDAASFFLTSVREYRRQSRKPSHDDEVASQREIPDEEASMQASLDACDVLERWCDEVSIPSTSSASSSAVYRATLGTGKHAQTHSTHRLRAVGQHPSRTADSRIKTQTAGSFPIQAVFPEEGRMTERTTQAAVRDLRALLRRPLPAIPLRHARTTASRSQYVNGNSSETHK